MSENTAAFTAFTDSFPRLWPPSLTRLKKEPLSDHLLNLTEYCSSHFHISESVRTQLCHGPKSATGGTQQS